MYLKHIRLHEHQQNSFSWFSLGKNWNTIKIRVGNEFEIRTNNFAAYSQVRIYLKVLYKLEHVYNIQIDFIIEYPD